MFCFWIRFHRSIAMVTGRREGERGERSEENENKHYTILTVQCNSLCFDFVSVSGSLSRAPLLLLLLIINIVFILVSFDMQLLGYRVSDQRSLCLMLCVAASGRPSIETEYRNAERRETPLMLSPSAARGHTQSSRNVIKVMRFAHSGPIVPVGWSATRCCGRPISLSPRRLGPIPALIMLFMRKRFAINERAEQPECGGCGAALDIQ